MSMMHVPSRFSRPGPTGPPTIRASRQTPFGAKPRVGGPVQALPQLRLSTLLWLVAVAAAFLAGVRYGEYRAPAPTPKWKWTAQAIGAIPADLKFETDPINSPPTP
jgi:hypothetical protein